MIDDNTDDPWHPDVFALTTTYQLNQLVEGSNGALYQSLSNLNIGNDPTITASCPAWLVGTTYAKGAYAFDSFNQIYTSNAAGNVGNTPSYNSTHWTYTGMWAASWTTANVSVPGVASNNWHYLSGSLQPINIVFPLGSGPLSQPRTRNLYLLPANYLERAPPEDNMGSKIAWLGARSAASEDYVFEGPYIISTSSSPLLLRFISDFQNVALMDPMFCEGLAARMGWELAGPLSQKPELRVACEREYKHQMGEARVKNAIEFGPTAPPQDDYISVRV